MRPAKDFDSPNIVDYSHFFTLGHFSVPTASGGGEHQIKNATVFNFT